jgi:hypothetical protein
VIGLTIVLATLLSYALGALFGLPALVPILNAAAGVPFMIQALRRGDLQLAVARMLIWVLAMGLCATLWSYARPAQTDALFLRAEPYRTAMFAWVLTGKGAESTPSQFIPEHALHAALFSALALATGSLLAMPMGAVLMNYMGHYVGALAGAGRHPVWTMMLGWHPWAVIRIVSFVVIGVVLSVPLLSRMAGARVDRNLARRFLVIAAVGLIADVVLKALLAPMWHRLLLRATGW